MHPAKVLVVDCPSLKPLPIRRDWYPGAQWTEGWPTREDCMQFLDGLDVVFSAETFYRDELPDICRGQGVKSVLQPNLELWDRTLPWPDLFCPPSLWRFDDFPDPKKHLPVPIATERFTPSDSSQARRFLHVVGRPAMHDRNGTADLLAALPLIRSDITLTIKCQEPGYVERHITSIPHNVQLSIEAGDCRDYWDLYKDQHVLILPRRYGGLCLPAQEALAAGMPVIMPNIEPNGWLPQEWLVPAQHAGNFYSKCHVNYYHTGPDVLAQRIDQFATDPSFFRLAKKQARELAEGMSWKALRPLYEKVLSEH